MSLPEKITKALDVSLLAAAKFSARKPQPMRPIESPSTGPRLCALSARALRSPVNCDITRPPTFVIAEIPPRRFNAYGVYLFRKARNYLTWYKDGFIQFVENANLRRVLKGELGKRLANLNIPGSAVIEMSRSEVQLMVRTRWDMRKFPGTHFS
jgi:hypothetical protein